jgi:hypothetical protein
MQSLFHPLSLFQVFNRIVQQKDEGMALQAVAVMQQGTVVDLTTVWALDAVLWTQDSDFTGLDDVNLCMKKG